MDQVAPVGPVYQAGTLSGNPLAVAAGLETLRMIQEDPAVYARLHAADAGDEPESIAAQASTDRHLPSLARPPTDRLDDAEARHETGRRAKQRHAEALIPADDVGRREPFEARNDDKPENDQAGHDDQDQLHGRTVSHAAATLPFDVE